MRKMGENFLSSCTVLSMSAYSVIRANIAKESLIDFKKGTSLAIGAAVGGVIGKTLFQSLVEKYDQNLVGATQAGCLLIITLGTLIYTLYKAKIKTHNTDSIVLCLLIGCFLGIMSSFLGIGGGPINVVVLTFFFSMPTKVASQNSIYIILFSLITSLVNSMTTGTVPDFIPLLLALMVIGGIAGAIAGRSINKKMDNKMVDQLFMVVMVVIIVVNIYNMVKFLA